MISEEDKAKMDDALAPQVLNHSPESLQPWLSLTAGEWLMTYAYNLGRARGKDDDKETPELLEE